MAHLMLGVLLLLILFLPFFVKPVEKEIEYFLFTAGLLAMTISGAWTGHAAAEAAMEPLKITVAVLVAGILFEVFSGKIAGLVRTVSKKTGTAWFIFIMVILIGFLSSVITAIIAALLLSEIMSHLKLPRKKEVKIVVISCFSIGLGAALTPIGEPLSTIVISKLQGPPYNADFLFLMRNFWMYITPAVIVLGAIAALLTGVGATVGAGLKEDRKENFRSVIVRGFKVYIFVAGLVFLGTGFKPLVESYIIKMPHYILYWVNIISAVLDNATLAAAEISPAMSMIQIKSAVLGLIISGGMLIPGNIPNIICANKLNIKSGEWAKYGLLIGMLLLITFFSLIMIQY